jgi:hypothetical protein
MSRLRDAFFQVCKEDVEMVTKCLLSGLSDEEVKKKKDTDWVFFLKYYRRLIPSKEILLTRFDRVCKFFGNILDSVTKKPLFTKKTWKAVGNLHRHIATGCLSDISGITMYYETGTSPSGLIRYRCVRGSCSNEGYHRHLRVLLHHHASSPQYLHYVLLEFNYRWNIRMSIRHQGLPEEIGGFYEQHMLEEVNSLATGIAPQKPYMAWSGTLELQDTTERVIFDTDQLAPQNGLPEPNDELIPCETITKSSRQYFQLIKSSSVCSPISTTDERRIFESDYLQQPTKPNFDDWAFEWNKFVETSDSDNMSQIFQKTPTQLRTYFNLFQKHINTSNTMAQHRDSNMILAQHLQRPSLDSILVSKPVPYVQPPSNANLQSGSRQVTEDESLVADESNQTEFIDSSTSAQSSVTLESAFLSSQPSAIAEAQQANAMKLPTILPKQTQTITPGNREAQPLYASNPILSRLPRSAVGKAITLSSSGALIKKTGRHCNQCGHLKLVNAFKAFHKANTGACLVPLEKRRVFDSCKKSNRQDVHWFCNPCSCVDCLPGGIQS